MTVLIVGTGALFLSLACARSAQAQDGSHSVGIPLGMIEGTVVTDMGKPVADATVFLRVKGPLGRTVASDVTDADGAFSLTSEVTGPLVIDVSHVAYGSTRADVVQDQTIRIVLNQAVISSPPVEIVASRGAADLAPVTVTNLSPADIRRGPTTKDLPAVLERTPSVTQYSENGNGLGYTYLRLRGFDQKRVAVAINGIPQNDPETFDVFWINFFDIQSSITDVQVQRGASGAYYGSTGIGGGINIVAMPYSPVPAASATVGYGSFDTRRFSLEGNSGLVKDRYIVRARLSRVLSDGYRDWSWSEYWRYFAGIRRMTDRSSVTVQAFGGPQRDGLAYVGIPKAANDGTVVDDFGSEVDRRFNVSAFTEDVERFRQPHLEFHHKWSPSSKYDLSQRVFYIRGVGHFDFDGSFRSANYLRLPDGVVADADRDQPLYAVLPGVPVLFRAALDQWHVGWQPSVRVHGSYGVTTVGGEARVHRSLRWGRIEEGEGLPPTVVGEGADVRVYSVRGEKIVGTLYGSHIARLGRNLALQADVALTAPRYRVFDEAFFGTSFSKQYLFANPRVGVTVFPDADFRAYASAAIARREPRLKALYDGEEAGAGATPQFADAVGGGYDYDQPFVTSESVIDIELGGELRRPRVRARATAYYMAFSNEIVPSGGLDQFGVPRTGNAERTRHAGLELESQLKVARPVEMWANATISSNEFVRFDEYVFDGSATVSIERDGNPIAGFPSVMGNAGVRYVSGSLTAEVLIRMRGRQYVDNSGGKNISGVPSDEHVVDAYTLVDASIRYTVRSGPFEGLALGADLTNLADRSVLLFGNSGFGAPQFFPAAGRHVFFELTYGLR